MAHPNGQHGRERMLCRACEDGHDPRSPDCIWELHARCDPITEFCSCPCDTGELEEEDVMKPTIGRIVIYRSKTGRYSVPAVVTATTETLYQPAVAGGHIPDLSSPEHVHLTVLTPGTPGERLPDTDPAIGSVNAGGTYQEWDIPYGGDNSGEFDLQPAGTWAWPHRETS
jgi:hypothetical protein